MDGDVFLETFWKTQLDNLANLLEITQLHGFALQWKPGNVVSAWFALDPAKS